MTRHFQSLAAAFLIAAAAAFPVRAEIDIQVVTSPGGITAWLYEEHSIPILDIEAAFTGGAAIDPEGSEGAVNLMAALLEEGAGDLDATGFAEAAEELAASFGFDAGQDRVSVSARMLTENRDETVALLRKALVEPRFDPEPFGRVQAQVLSGLRADETDPGTLASKAFHAQAFPGHPYARPDAGSVESVAALGPG